MNSWAQVGTTTDALGGASIGNTHPLDSVWTNPAGVGAKAGTYAGVQYYGGKSFRPDLQLDQYSLTITDASTGAFPGSLGYRYRSYKDGGYKVKEQVFRAAAAFALQQNLVVGLAGYRVHTDPPIGEKTDQDNGDVSILWMPILNLQLGAITRGVVGAKDNMFGPSRVVPSGGFGAKYSFNSSISVLGDVNYGYEDIGTGKRLQTQLGLEFINTYDVAVRIGYNNDEWRGERRMTAGIGWEGPKLKAGYSYQNENRKELGESHTVDIWLSF